MQSLDRYSELFSYLYRTFIELSPRCS